MSSRQTIEIFKKNEATIVLQCNETISRELYNYFSAYATNYKFAPLYRQKIWDGKIRFFSLTSNELPIGLLQEVYEFANKGKYEVLCNFKIKNDISREQFKKFVDGLNIPFEVRDYQFEAAYQGIVKKHLNIQASTSSGKSLIIYIICRFMHYINKKVLVLVPQTQLVEQLFTDFRSYGWDSERYCHRIYEGQKKFYDAPITISCWQSMSSFKVKKDNPYENFGCLINDEAHLSAAKSLQNLAKYCINSEYRFGFSGTYPENTIADWYSIVGALGQIQTFTTYKSLQDGGYITKLKINNIVLNYSDEIRKQVYDECGNEYSLQNNMIYGMKSRNLFLLKLAQTFKENCLILFTKKEAHGYILKELFETYITNKQVVYIDGDIPISDREDIRKLMEERNDVILLASYGTLAVGVNIKNLHHIVFASGYKSKQKIYQSIGRVLRLNPNKECAKLYDIVDNLSFIDGPIRFVNHSLKHYKERLKYYQAENWEIKTIKHDLN